MPHKRVRDWHRDGVTYLRWSLSSSQPLAVEAVRRVAIDMGIMEAFVPAAQDVENFKWGGGATVDECVEEIVGACLAFLSKPGRMVIFEHHLVTSTDPHGYLTSPVRVAQGAVYQLAFAGADAGRL